MYSRWWFDTSFFFLPLPGKMIHFDYFFSTGLKPIFADMSKTDSPLSVLQITFGLPREGHFHPKRVEPDSEN